ncbi:MAG: alpha/beta fold hydrolase [Sulfurimonas sp.]|nr:alpha/beta fold hydrolase [Sulfurimonas sp.]
MKKILLILVFISTLFANEITITSDDGFKLYAWLNKPISVKKSTPIIVFVHQFSSDHKTWSELAKKFNVKGFATLNVDLRGHGESIYQNQKKNKIIVEHRMEYIKSALVTSDKNIAFDQIPADLIAWIELISEDGTLDMDQLYLFGSSLGGVSILPLLSEYEVKGLVSISAGKSKKLTQDIDMALAMSMTKSLFIASKNDPLGAADNSIEYANKSISGTSLIISDNGHGTVLLPKVEHYIFSFIDSIK